MTSTKSITVSQMSEMLNLSLCYCYQLVHRPDFFPAFRVGRKILINLDRLNEWIEKQQREGV